MNSPTAGPNHQAPQPSEASDEVRPAAVPAAPDEALSSALPARQALTESPVAQRFGIDVAEALQQHYAALEQAFVDAVAAGRTVSNSCAFDPADYDRLTRESLIDLVTRANSISLFPEPRAFVKPAPGDPVAEVAASQYEVRWFRGVGARHLQTGTGIQDDIAVLSALECPHGKSEMRIVAFITNAREVSKIADSLGIPPATAPPPIPTAPQQELFDEIPRDDFI